MPADLSIGDNYELDEDSNGDLVIKDSSDTVVLKHDESAGKWLPQQAIGTSTDPVPNTSHITNIQGTDLQYDSVTTDDLYTAGRNGTYFVYKDGTDTVAVGESTTIASGSDATAVIQSVIDDASNGDKIVCAADTFRVDNLNPKSKALTWEGAAGMVNGGTVFETSSDVFHISASNKLQNSTFRDIVFRGTEAGARAIGQDAGDLSANGGYTDYGLLYTYFERCQFDLSLQYGIEANAIFAWFNSCQFGYYGSPNIMEAGLNLRGYQGARVNASVVNNSHITGMDAISSAVGIHVENVGANFAIRNTTIEIVSSFAVDAGGVDTLLMDNVHGESINSGGAIFNLTDSQIAGAPPSHALLRNSYFYSNSNTQLFTGLYRGNVVASDTDLNAQWDPGAGNNVISGDWWPSRAVGTSAGGLSAGVPIDRVQDGFEVGRALSSPPPNAPNQNLVAGDWYFDDGTNTILGVPMMRVYDGSKWVDATHTINMDVSNGTVILSPVPGNRTVFVSVQNQSGTGANVAAALVYLQFEYEGDAIAYQSEMANLNTMTYTLSVNASNELEVSNLPSGNNYVTVIV